MSVDILKFLINNGGTDLEEYGPEALFCALQTEDKETVSILVEAGVGLGSPLLSRIKSWGDVPSVAMLECLLELGANSELFNLNFLQVAIKAYDLDVINFLCQNFVDINSPGRRGRYPIQVAMKKPSPESVKYLIKLGTDPNPPPNQLKGLTTLNYALRGGNREIVDLVINAGAAVVPDERVYLIETIFESCYYTLPYSPGIPERLEMFRFLLDNRASPRISHEPRTNSALTRLITYSDSKDLICKFIEAGADVNQIARDSYDETPLQAAASKGNTELIECLLEKGAEINAPAGRFCFGRTALQAACDRSADESYIAPIELLLSRGADVNARAGIEYGVTALQATAIRGQMKAAMLLLNAGADVNADGAIKEGRNALDGAAEHGRLDMVQLLLNAGACSNKTEDGTLGFDEAIRLAELEGHWAVSALIRSHIGGL